MEAEKTTRIDPSLIPASEFDTACRVLDEGIRLLFRKPGIEAEYNEFLKTYKQPERRKENDRRKIHKNAPATT